MSKPPPPFRLSSGARAAHRESERSLQTDEFLFQQTGHGGHGDDAGPGSKRRRDCPLWQEPMA